MAKNPKTMSASEGKAWCVKLSKPYEHAGFRMMPRHDHVIYSADLLEAMKAAGVVADVTEQPAG